MTQKSTYTLNPWSLKDLFDGFDDPKYKASFEEIKKGVKAFEAFREQLTPDIIEDMFINIISEYERLYKLLSRLNGFAQLAFAADTQDQEAQAEVAKVDQFQAEIVNQTLFFNLWWKAGRHLMTTMRRDCLQPPVISNIGWKPCATLKTSP